MHNAMAYAFIKSGIRNINSNLGLFKHGWNAHLSFRTHRALVDAGYSKFNG